MGQKDFLTTKIKDAAESAIYRQETVYLDFYEPSVQLLIEREIARYPSSDCAFFGGHPYCERKILCVFPKGEPPQDEEFPIACVQIATDEPITHQDVLGALLGLGIEREKTGDINLSAQMIQLFVAETLGEFVERNLTQINRYAVEAKVVGTNGLSRLSRFSKRWTSLFRPRVPMPWSIHCINFRGVRRPL
jgi:RNA-binding protein YlmH